MSLVWKWKHHCPSAHQNNWLSELDKTWKFQITLKNFSLNEFFPLSSQHRFRPGLHEFRLFCAMSYFKNTKCNFLRIMTHVSVTIMYLDLRASNNVWPGDHGGRSSWKACRLTGRLSELVCSGLEWFLVQKLFLNLWRKGGQGCVGQQIVEESCGMECSCRLLLLYIHEYFEIQW